MNLEQLHYIVEVAKTKSLSAASNNLHVSQSALSQSIANLEAELGIRIFQRSRLGSRPTPEGMPIIAKALEVIGKLQEMKEEARQLSPYHEAELRVASFPAAMKTLLQTVSSIRKDYPNVTIRIIESGSKETLEAIRHNKVDIGLIGTKQNEDNLGTGIAFDPIWEGKIICADWEEAVTTNAGGISPEEMRQKTFVLYDEEYIHEFILKYTKMHGPLNILFTSNNPIAISTAVKERLGVTIGYDFSFLERLNGNTVLREIEQMEQEQPILLGWARSETNKETHISKTFIQRFARQFQLSNLN
ncbi:LysR family transcriptional regulator [Paenibacillus sp. GCM10027627]|uniref:LysR family transcriptional regulator n=1 Tax=unclassified Paenibacillus TaxID=185978 RepID=UPI003645CE36